MACLGTFNLDLSNAECQALFDSCDANKDESLDEHEFTEGLFGGGQSERKGAEPESHKLFSDENSKQETKAKMVNQEELDKVNSTHNKIPLDHDQLLDYPFFFKNKINNLNLNTFKLGFKPHKRSLSIVSTKETLSTSGPSGYDETATVVSLVKKKDFLPSPSQIQILAAHTATFQQQPLVHEGRPASQQKLRIHSRYASTGSAFHNKNGPDAPLLAQAKALARSQAHKEGEEPKIFDLI
jgi:hypothetical protein